MIGLIIVHDGTIECLSAYDSLLQLLYIYDEEMAFRTGTYSRLVDCIMKHVGAVPALYPQIAPRLKYLIEDLEDCGDSDLASMAIELRTFLEKVTTEVPDN